MHAKEVDVLAYKFLPFYRLGRLAIYSAFSYSQLFYITTKRLLGDTAQYADTVRKSDEKSSFAVGANFSRLQLMHAQRNQRTQIPDEEKKTRRS